MPVVSLLRTRLLTPHVKTCLYRSGQSDQHPWVISATYDGMKHENRNAVGKKTKGSFRWIPFRCNDPECPANGIIRLDSIELQIPEQP